MHVDAQRRVLAHQRAGGARRDRGGCGSAGSRGRRSARCPRARARPQRRQRARRPGIDNRHAAGPVQDRRPRSRPARRRNCRSRYESPEASVIMGERFRRARTNPMIPIDDNERERHQPRAADPAFERGPAVRQRVARATPPRVHQTTAPWRCRRGTPASASSLPPASTAPTTRRPVMKRAANTVFGPWRSKKRSNSASRSRVRPMPPAVALRDPTRRRGGR